VLGCLSWLAAPAAGVAAGSAIVCS